MRIGKTSVLVAAILGSALLAASPAAGSNPGGGPEGPPLHSLDGAVVERKAPDTVVIELTHEHGRNEYACHVGEQIAARKLKVTGRVLPGMYALATPGLALRVEVDHAETVRSVRLLTGCIVRAEVVRAPAAGKTNVDVKLAAVLYGGSGNECTSAPIAEAAKAGKELAVPFVPTDGAQLAPGATVEVGLTDELVPTSLSIPSAKSPGPAPGLQQSGPSEP